MPNGDDHRPAPSIEEQIINMRESERLHSKAIWKALERLGEVQSENEQIRNVAGLPPKKYDWEFSYENTSWTVPKPKL